MLDITAMSVDDWVKVGSGIGAVVIAWFGWKRGDRARQEAPPFVTPDGRAVSDAIDRLSRVIRDVNAADAIERLARATEANLAAQREEDQFARLVERMRVMPSPSKLRRYSRLKR